MIRHRWMNCAALVLALGAAVRALGDEVSLLRIRVLEGEGSVYRCGSRATGGLAVEITGEGGRPVEGATVSYRLPETGPGGAFTTGLSTAVVATDASGRAAARGIRWNNKPGPVNIAVTAVKGNARAGTAIFVYLSETATGPSHSGKGLKWAALVVLAGGGAAGAVYALNGRVKASQPATAAPPPLSIGQPAITVGKP